LHLPATAVEDDAVQINAYYTDKASLSLLL